LLCRDITGIYLFQGLNQFRNFLKFLFLRHFKKRKKEKEKKKTKGVHISQMKYDDANNFYAWKINSHE